MLAFAVAVAGGTHHIVVGIVIYGISFTVASGTFACTRAVHIHIGDGVAISTAAAVTATSGATDAVTTALVVVIVVVGLLVVAGRDVVLVLRGVIVVLLRTCHFECYQFAGCQGLLCLFVHYFRLGIVCLFDLFCISAVVV